MFQQQVIVTEKSTSGRFAIQGGAAIELFLLQITLRNVFIPDTGQISLEPDVAHSLLDIWEEQKILVNSFWGACFSALIVQHAATESQHVPTESSRCSLTRWFICFPTVLASPRHLRGGTEAVLMRRTWILNAVDSGQLQGRAGEGPATSNCAAGYTCWCRYELYNLHRLTISLTIPQNLKCNRCYFRD